jgi:hypothetical protein
MSSETTRCSLPEGPLDYYSINVNFTALHDPGFDFSSLSPGRPVQSYTVYVSNDGVEFSNGQPMRVVDTLCMDCSGETCVQKVVNA